MALAFQVTLSVMAIAREEDVNVVVDPAVARHQHVSLGPAGPVEEPRDGRPLRVVERGLVQGLQGAFEQGVPAHGGSTSPGRPPAGSAEPGEAHVESGMGVA